MTPEPVGIAPDRLPWRTPTRVVVGVVAAVALLVALTLLGELQADPPASRVVLDVALGLVCLALTPVLFVRTVPAAVALAGLAALSPLATPPSTAAIVMVARTRPFPTAVAVAVLGTGTHVVRGLWRPLPDLPFVWWVVLAAVTHAGLLGWGALSRARAQVLMSLRERALRAEADRDRLVEEARAGERARIAREMHDVLAHRLSLLATYAGALEYRPDAPPEKLAHAAGIVRAGVHQALEELREVIGVLRYAGPDGGGDGAGDGSRDRSLNRAAARPQPGVAQLDDLVEETRGAGTPVELTVDVGGEPPGLVGRTAYRVVQEGLTNALKHAPGRAVVATVSGTPGPGLDVTLTNRLPAVGDTDVPGSSTGLIGLTERVRIVGGRLEHGVEDGRFRLHAWLPWQP